MKTKMNSPLGIRSEQRNLAFRPGILALDWHPLVQKEILVFDWQAAGGYELATEQQGLGLPPFHSVPEC
jgi:hypothetical protein